MPLYPGQACMLTVSAGNGSNDTFQSACSRGLITALEMSILKRASLQLPSSERKAHDEHSCNSNIEIGFTECLLSCFCRRRSKISRRWPVNLLLALCLAPFLAFHVLIVYRICIVSYDWPALLFSPGLAWTMPLAALLLGAHWSSTARPPVKQKAT